MQVPKGNDKILGPKRQPRARVIYDRMLVREKTRCGTMKYWMNGKIKGTNSHQLSTITGMYTDGIYQQTANRVHFTPAPTAMISMALQLTCDTDQK